MSIRKLITGVAAVGLMTSPLAAQAAPVQSARTASEVEDSEALVGIAPWIIAAVVAVAVGVIVIADGDDEEPASP